ncbi:hypothetical protein ACXIUS_28290 [Bosea thiooxidans]
MTLHEWTRHEGASAQIIPEDRGLCCSLRADGPYSVHLRIAGDPQDSMLKEVADWLAEWRMPHLVRVLSISSDRICVVELRFPDKKHAHAVARRFAACLTARPSN